MKALEKQYDNVTPRQAQVWLEKAAKKLNIDVDIECVAHSQNNISNHIEAKNGVTTRTDLKVPAYKKQYYDGNGKKTNEETKYYEYAPYGYQKSIEETPDTQDYTEYYIDEPGYYQTYYKSNDNYYNLIIQFDWTSDAKGTCYFYYAEENNNKGEKK